MIIRKRFDALTPEQRKEFLEAIIALKKETVTLPDQTEVGKYDQFVALHLGVRDRRRANANIGDGGHGGPAFLAWHRRYLVEIEKELQRVSQNKELAIPYWDWTEPQLADLLFSSDYFGTNGTGKEISPKAMGNIGKVVENGVFTNANGWTLDDRIHIWHTVMLDSVQDYTEISGGEALIRDMLPKSDLPSSDLITKYFTDDTFDDFSEFRRSIEADPRMHNFMHSWVSGTMALSSSPYDPIFLLNHAFIDYIWALWQSTGHWGAAYYYKKPSKKQSGTPEPTYGHQLTDKMWPWDAGESVTHEFIRELLPDLSAAGTTTPQDVLDCKSLGYSYVDWARVKETLNNIIGKWSAERGGRVPKLAIKHAAPNFGWDSAQQLAETKVFQRYPLIEPSKVANGQGFDTYLVEALLEGVDGMDRMPLGEPYLEPMEIAEIAHWIDMGMP